MSDWWDYISGTYHEGAAAEQAATLKGLQEQQKAPPLFPPPSFFGLETPASGGVGSAPPLPPAQDVRTPGPPPGSQPFGRDEPPSTDARAPGSAGAEEKPPQESPQDKKRREDAEAHKQALSGMAKRFEEYQKHVEDYLAAQQRSMAAPLPQVPEQKKVREPPPQDLGQNANQWLMAASVLGGLAGLASRRSGINALSAFSGALDGFAAGDMQRFKANYEHWKAESDTTIKNNQIEMDRYEAIIKRRDLDQKQRSSLIEIEGVRLHNEFIRGVAAEAARRGDDATLMVAIDGTQGKMAEYAISQQKMRDNVEAMIEKAQLQQSGAFKQRLPQSDIEQRSAMLAQGDRFGAYRDIGVNDPNRGAIDQGANELLKQENPGASNADIGRIMATRAQQYAGGTSEARVTGTQAAGIKGAAEQLTEFGRLALQASDSLPRGNYTSWNEFNQAIKRESGDPQLLAFTEFNQSLIRAYARTMAASGGGRGGVYYQQEAARMLSTATSAAGYRAQVEAMFKNVNAELRALARRQGQPEPQELVPPAAPPRAQRPEPTPTQQFIKKWIGTGQFMDLGGGWSVQPEDDTPSDAAAAGFIGARALGRGIEKGLENIGPAVIGGVVGHMIP